MYCTVFETVFVTTAKFYGMNDIFGKTKKAVHYKNFHN